MRTLAERAPAPARASFEVFESIVDDRAEAWSALERSVGEHARDFDEADRAEIAALLYPDVFSEYDARFLSAYLQTLDVGLSEEFWRCERAWARDEALHYAGFRTAYGAALDRRATDIDAEMAARAKDVTFAPLADLFCDEFSIACLFAYDELATVRAYRANRAQYARLGPEMERFVHQVTADEGRHCRNFYLLLRTKHTHRLGDVEATITRIREREGVPYGNTFVLDHDDDVWSDELFDEAASVLCRHLRP